jgi:hypothetical protein
MLVKCTETNTKGINRLSLQKEEKQKIKHRVKIFLSTELAYY